MIKYADIVKTLTDYGLFVSEESGFDFEKDNTYSGFLTDSKKLGEAKSDNLDKVFVCIRGFKVDSHELIEAISRSNVKLFIVETRTKMNKKDVCQVMVSDSRAATALLGKLFFKDPSKKFNLIGITGTNGKTTTGFMTYKLFSHLGYRVGFIGTIGYYIKNKFYKSNLTTPDVIELNQIFVQMVNEGIDFVIMEVSSHAIKLKRVFGLKFTMAVFTNLSREHLDFHGTMREYGLVKFTFLDHVSQKGGKVILNFDDSQELINAIDNPDDSAGKGFEIFDYKNGCRKASGLFIKKLTGKKDIIVKGYDLNKNSLFDNNKVNIRYIYSISNSKLSLSDQYFDLEKSSGESNELFRVYTNITGKYNYQNLTTALAIIQNFTLSLNPLIDKTFFSGTRKNVRLDNLDMQVPGRFEKVGNDFGVNCYIDFAHTPDALENVLQNLLELKRSSTRSKDCRIITVFGAGGNRDRGKRPKMSRSALKYSNLVILTSDNPRDESQQAILGDLVEGISRNENILLLEDRESAIRTAVFLAHEGDFLLIAGKGHEAYQEVGGEKVYFNDKIVAQEAFRLKGELLPGNSDSGEVDSRQLSAKHSNSTIELAIPLSKVFLDFALKGTLKNNRNVKADESRYYNSVSADTRTISDNSVYFALIGKKYDGHDFIDKALSYQGNLAVVQRDRWKAFYDKYESDIDKLLSWKDRIIIVDDTLKSYALLASKYRSLFNIKMIGVTGSFGKTTTKEIIYNILSEDGYTLKSFANENNIIGLSKTLFNIKYYHKFCIAELGTNQPGEIELLTRISKPDIGLITGIGPSHLEFLGNIDGVYKEKTALFKAGLEARIAFYDSRLKSYCDNRIDYVGVNKNCQYQVRKEWENDKGTYININSVIFELQKNKDIYRKNVIIAISLAMYLNLKKDKIQRGLSKSYKTENRMQIELTEGKKIIFDCYNANPDSMREAIKYWADLDPDVSHVAILGDMLELGRFRKKYHREVGLLLKEVNSKVTLKVVITVGNLAKHYADYLIEDRHLHFDNVDELLNLDLEVFFPKNCILLVKGSNSLKLDKLKGLFIKKG